MNFATRKKQKSGRFKSLKNLKHQEALSVCKAPIVPPTSARKKPGFDFYLYVNDNWLKTVHVPTFRASYGVSEEIEQLIKENLIDAVAKSKNTLLTEFISSTGPQGRKESVQLLKSMIRNLNCIRDTRDLSKTLGEFANLKIRSMFSVDGYYKAGRTVKIECNLSPGHLGLPDPSYYVNEAPGKSRTLFAYGRLLDSVAKRLGLEEKFSEVIPIESFFSKALATTDDEVVIIGSKLPTTFKLIDWDAFWEGAGLENWKDRSIKLGSKTWIHEIERGINELTLTQWKLLLSVHLTLYAIKLLPAPFDTINFEFFDRRLKGQSKKPPLKEFTINLLQRWMPVQIGELYIKRCMEPNLRETITQFIGLIKAAAEDHIQKTECFTPNTRAAALNKIRKMRMGLVHPESTPPMKIKSIHPDNLLKNILALGKESTQRDMERLNHTVNIERCWEDHVFAVNGYYYSETNELILPAGGIQWPFYSKKAPQGWNFGGLGAVVGHEMMHAFDSDGRLTNEYGEDEDWWSAADTKEYLKRTTALARLFGHETIMAHHVDGILTLNENIADLGGLAIALDALQLELGKATDDVRKQAYQNFFTAYAVSWRVKEKPQKILQGLFMDRHAPASLRVNLIVSQFDEWYEAFDIQPTDPLYIAPEKRIRIF